MMVDIARDAQPNPFGFEEELSENANCMAKLSMEYLSTIGISPTATSSSCPPDEYPAGLLLEIAAIARLRHWEQVGIKDAIDPTLPDSEQALSELNERFQDQTWQVMAVESPLLRKILLTWWKNCARGSRQQLGVDMALEAPSQELLVESVAQLLWQLRELPALDVSSN